MDAKIPELRVERLFDRQSLGIYGEQGGCVGLTREVKKPGAARTLGKRAPLSKVGCCVAD